MKMVKRTTFAERVNHWVLAISFFVLLLTGLGFLFHSLSWLNTIFGGAHLASAIHKWGGAVFGLSVLYSAMNYLTDAVSFGPEDSAWIGSFGGYLSDAKVPEQGRLNAGQKLFYLTVFVFGLLISFSGLVLWLLKGERVWMQVGHLLHNLAFIVLVTAVPLHVYLGTAANPGTFRGMTRGTVTLSWAKRHHGKWVREKGLG